MVMPVPPLGLFQTGIPASCAAAGDAAPRVRAKIVSPRFMSLLRRQSRRPDGPAPEYRPANGRKPPPASQHCVVSMHPHGADRHAFQIAQPRADAGVEHAAEAKIGTEP